MAGPGAYRAASACSHLEPLQHACSSLYRGCGVNPFGERGCSLLGEVMHIWTPRLAKLSVNDGEQERLQPYIRAVLRHDVSAPDGFRWLSPGQQRALAVPYITQVYSATV